MRATVLLPTRGASPTLGRVVERVLAQTAADLELLVVGDGLAAEGRETVEQLARRDRRIKVFDLPKGPRRGELHRHAALQQALGEIVCYVTDDDLWSLDHVETMLGLLGGGADWAHAPSLVAMPDGTIGNLYAVDHAVEADRKLTLEGAARVHLSCAAHTLAMYRNLPFGWRTTPDGVYTDHYMWRQFLAEPSCRARSGTRPTVVCFPTAPRAGWSGDRLVAEFDSWRERLDDPVRREGFHLELIDFLVRDRAALALERTLSPFARLRALAGRSPFLRRVARGARALRVRPR